MPSFILQNDYENLRKRVDELKQRLIERCSQLDINEKQVFNEFFKEVLIRAVHESNWQEGIELNEGRTQELSNAAFDDLEEIQGPHLDMNKILRFHRDVVIKLKQEKKSEEEIATYNLAKAYQSLGWICSDLTSRQGTSIVQALLALKTEYEKHEHQLSPEARASFENAMEKVRIAREDATPVSSPLTSLSAKQGDRVNELLKLDPDSLQHPMKPDYIHFLHKLVLMGILPMKKCGKYRSTSVHVGNPDVYFPVPSAVPSLMKEYCRHFPAIFPGAITYDPIMAAAIVSHRFVAIHPYPDGNGRVSRLLMNLVLWDHFPPVYLKADKKGRHRYSQAIRRADRGNLKPLAALITLSIIEIYEKMLNALKS
jgi:Fic family protein